MLSASKDYKSHSLSSNNMDRHILQEGTIKCPHCGELVPINSTLHKQLAETVEEDIKEKILGATYRGAKEMGTRGKRKSRGQGNGGAPGPARGGPGRRQATQRSP